eukprot:TRINITY_DN3873_c0_g1_i1.p1 TRINITY_DN3873_c0_g1~~TRINITY_DN3873_c0_g1_i1.p1  ORF type:complete len:1865 (-),score=207.80 TRINITY_DN3873_c0_g1_i1:47-5413(-)
MVDDSAFGLSDLLFNDDSLGKSATEETLSASTSRLAKHGEDYELARQVVHDVLRKISTHSERLATGSRTSDATLKLYVATTTTGAVGGVVREIRSANFTSTSGAERFADSGIGLPEQQSSDLTRQNHITRVHPDLVLARQVLRDALQRIGDCSPTPLVGVTEKGTVANDCSRRLATDALLQVYSRVQEVRILNVTASSPTASNCAIDMDLDRQFTREVFQRATVASDASRLFAMDALLNVYSRVHEVRMDGRSAHVTASRPTVGDGAMDTDLVRQCISDVFQRVGNNSENVGAVSLGASAAVSSGTAFVPTVSCRRACFANVDAREKSSEDRSDADAQTREQSGAAHKKVTRVLPDLCLARQVISDLVQRIGNDSVFLAASSPSAPSAMTRSTVLGGDDGTVAIQTVVLTDPMVLGGEQGMMAENNLRWLAMDTLMSVYSRVDEVRMHGGSSNAIVSTQSVSNCATCMDLARQVMRGVLQRMGDSSVDVDRGCADGQTKEQLDASLQDHIPRLLLDLGLARQVLRDVLQRIGDSSQTPLVGVTGPRVRGGEKGSVGNDCSRRLATDALMKWERQRSCGGFLYSRVHKVRMDGGSPNVTESSPATSKCAVDMDLARQFIREVFQRVGKDSVNTRAALLAPSAEVSSEAASVLTVSCRRVCFANVDAREKSSENESGAGAQTKEESGASAQNEMIGILPDMCLARQVIRDLVRRIGIYSVRVAASSPTASSAMTRPMVLGGEGCTVGNHDSRWLTTKVLLRVYSRVHEVREDCESSNAIATSPRALKCATYVDLARQVIREVLHRVGNDNLNRGAALRSASGAFANTKASANTAGSRFVCFEDIDAHDELREDEADANAQKKRQLRAGAPIHASVLPELCLARQVLRDILQRIGNDSVLVADSLPTARVEFTGPRIVGGENRTAAHDDSRRLATEALLNVYSHVHKVQMDGGSSNVTKSSPTTSKCATDIDLARQLMREVLQRFGNVSENVGVALPTASATASSETASVLTLSCRRVCFANVDAREKSSDDECDADAQTKGQSGASAQNEMMGVLPDLCIAKQVIRYLVQRIGTNDAPLAASSPTASSAMTRPTVLCGEDCTVANHDSGWLTTSVLLNVYSRVHEVSKDCESSNAVASSPRAWKCATFMDLARQVIREVLHRVGNDNVNTGVALRSASGEFANTKASAYTVGSHRVCFANTDALDEHCEDQADANAQTQRHLRTSAPNHDSRVLPDLYLARQILRDVLQRIGNDSVLVAASSPTASSVMTCFTVLGGEHVTVSNDDSQWLATDALLNVYSRVYGVRMDGGSPNITESSPTTSNNATDMDLARQFLSEVLQRVGNGRDKVGAVLRAVSGEVSSETASVPTVSCRRVCFANLDVPEKSSEDESEADAQIIEQSCAGASAQNIVTRVLPDLRLARPVIRDVVQRIGNDSVLVEASSPSAPSWMTRPTVLGGEKGMCDDHNSRWLAMDMLLKVYSRVTEVRQNGGSSNATVSSPEVSNCATDTALARQVIRDVLQRVGTDNIRASTSYGSTWESGRVENVVHKHSRSDSFLAIGNRVNDLELSRLDKIAGQRVDEPVPSSILPSPKQRADDVSTETELTDRGSSGSDEDLLAMKMGAIDGSCRGDNSTQSATSVCDADTEFLGSVLSEFSTRSVTSWSPCSHTSFIDVPSGWDDAPIIDQAFNRVGQTHQVASRYSERCTWSKAFVSCLLERFQKRSKRGDNETLEVELSRFDGQLDAGTATEFNARRSKPSLTEIDVPLREPARARMAGCVNSIRQMFGRQVR